MFSNSKYVQKLEKAEAARTLVAYDRDHPRTVVYKSTGIKHHHHQQKFLEKPFKCGMCEFRAAHMSSTNRHMRLIHKVGYHEAKRLVKVLTLDVAKKTLREYSKNFGCSRDPNCTEQTNDDNNNRVEYQIIQLDNASSANGKTKPVSSEEENAQTEQELVKQRLHRTAVNNKKFKCVKCFFRSNRSRDISTHFSKAHRHVALTRLQRVQVLDDDEATRTLAAYEKNHKSRNNFLCKPYKCGLCEYRAAHKSNAKSHVHHFHKLEFLEADRLVEVLPLDEAEKTVEEYNNKFGRGYGYHTIVL
jgi:hypothetical protein